MIWLIVALTIATNAVSHWYLSRGDTRTVYRMNVLVYLGYIVVETWLGLRDESQRAVLLYNISNVWALSMAVKGAIREQTGVDQGSSKES